MTDTSLVPTAGPGQPSKILKYGNKVIEFVAQGYPIKRCTEMAGVSYQTHRDWYVRGELGRKFLDEGGNPSSGEYIYIDYYDRYEQASNQRRKLLADVIYSSALGGDRIKETRTLEVTDVNGNHLRSEKVETIKELPKDWRAAAFYLKMMHRDDWHTRVDQNTTHQLSAQDALAQALSGMDEQSKQIALRNLALVASLTDGDDTNPDAAADAIEGDFEPVEEVEAEDDAWL